MVATTRGDGDGFGLLSAENGTYRIFLCCLAARFRNRVGRRFESRGAKKSSRDEGRNEVSRLRDRRRQKRRGDGGSSFREYRGPQKSNRHHQSRQTSRPSCFLGGHKSRLALRRFSARPPRPPFRRSPYLRAIQGPY